MKMNTLIESKTQSTQGIYVAKSFCDNTNDCKNTVQKKSDCPNDNTKSAGLNT